MKKIVCSCLSVIVVSVLLMSHVAAQPGIVTGTKYGKGDDSVKCLRALSLYQQDFEHKNYEAAIVNWRFVYKNCPASSVNNFVRGIVMYQYLITKENDQAKKNALVDTLMLIYEASNKYQSRYEGRNAGMMALDLIKFQDTPERYEMILNLLERSMTIQKEKTPAQVFANYMVYTLTLFKEKKLTDEQVLANYNKVGDIIGNAIKQTPTEELAKARNVIDDNFAKSDAASCENLIKIYTAKFEENKNDIDFLRKLTRLLNKNSCTESDLFEKASEQQFALEPSAAAAYNMAKLFLRKDNFDKAVEYFESAIEHETEPYDKADYLLQLGTIRLVKFNKYVDARKCALDAIKLHPGWGEPYILIANAYIAGGRDCGADEFEKAQIYWVIVDKLVQAKSADSECAEKVNPMISSYSKYYPKKEEAFFRGIKEGDSVTVGCWVNETTKVRF